MNINKINSFLIISLVVVSLNGSEWVHIDGTSTPQEQVRQATKAVNETAAVLSDVGVDASIGLLKTTLWENKDKTIGLKFGTSLSLMKMLQGKMAINDLVGPSFDIEAAIPGCSQKLGLKLKLFSLLSYTTIFRTIKLPGSMSDFLAKLSDSFASYIKKSDKSVAAAFVAYFWFNHCGGAAKFIKGDSKDDAVLQKRMILSALVGFMTSYGIKNFNNSKLGKAAVAASALFAALSMAPSSVIDRTPFIA